MKADAISLRQVAVLTVTGLLAPAADLLPTLLGRQVGRGAWLVPVLVLPAALLGTALWESLAKCPGGRGIKWLSPIYIMWGTAVLASRLSHTARRLGAVYNAGAGLALTALVLALCLWMVWRGLGGLCRAAELFWLAMGVAVAALLLLSLSQLRPERLAPEWAELSALPGAWLDCLGVLGTAALAAPLARRAEGKKRRRLLGWTTAACLLIAALLAAVVGQVGPQLTARLEQPFFIMVQGLSLKGGFARLEAPVAALWLLADFAALGLPLAAIRTLAGESAGRWLAAAAALAAGVGALFPVWDWWMILGGLWLGNFLPLGWWVLCKMKRRAR